MTKAKRAGRVSYDGVDYRDNDYQSPFIAFDATIKHQRPNSRKALVRMAYDKSGFDDALKLGLSLRPPEGREPLKASTIRTWANTWRRAKAAAEKASKRKPRASRKAKPAAVEAAS